MELTISSTALEAVVKILKKVVNPKCPIPILQNIYCDVRESDHKIHLTASDGGIWLTYELCIMECEGSGKFCVDAETLCNAFSEIAEQPVTLTIDGEVLNIKHQSGNTHMAVLGAENFIEPKAIDGDTEMVSINGDTLQKETKRVMWAANKDDDQRPVIQGILLDFQVDGTYKVVATDGHVLMQSTQVEEEGTVKCGKQLIIPQKVAKLIPDILPGIDMVDIMFNENTACIKDGNMWLTFCLVEGKFPKYDSVIPRDFAHTAIVMRATLIDRLRNVVPFSNESTNIVKIKFEERALTLTTEDIDYGKGATDTLSIELTGEPIEIGAKGSTLLAILSKMTQQRVTIKTISHDRPIVIEDYYEEGEASTVLGLVMPMLLLNE